MLLGTWTDGIWLVPVDGGSPRLLYEPQDTMTAARPTSALWAPDGHTVYFKAADRKDRGSVWAIPNTGRPRILVRFDDPLRPSYRTNMPSTASGCTSSFPTGRATSTRQASGAQVGACDRGALHRNFRLFFSDKGSR